MVKEAVIAVMRINSQTPRGEGSGGLFRFMFRRVFLMIVLGRKTSPAAVVCVCVFIVLFWFCLFVFFMVEIVFRLEVRDFFRLVGWSGVSGQIFVFGEDHGAVIVGIVVIVSRIKTRSMIFPSRRESSDAVIVPALKCRVICSSRLASSC